MAIIKHNKLIETSYRLNSREQFFVLFLISQISQSDNEFRDYKMHYSEIERILNFDGKRRIANKNEVFSIMDNLNDVPIIYEKGNIIGKSVWLQHMEFNKDTEEFTFSLSAKLRDYLLQLKEHFTKYNISNIVYLNASAIRFYDVLKRHQFKGECEIQVEKIKFYLGIEGRYSKYYEFKRWVLIPAQQEIEKYTDIRFEFEPARKKGKSILSLRFLIYENEPQYSPEKIKLLAKLNGKSHSKNIPGLTKDEIGNVHQRKLSKLNKSQLQAYNFLTLKGINKVFVLDQILFHPKVSYEPVRGYEDIYVQMLWQFFTTKTNSPEKAGTFVNWWKNGHLTEDSFHARIMEALIKRKKEMKPAERESRESARYVTAKEYEFSLKFKGGDTLDMEQFKKDYPKQYQKIKKKVRAEYEEAFRSLNEKFEHEKYRKSIEDKVFYECKSWLKEYASITSKFSE